MFSKFPIFRRTPLFLTRRNILLVVGASAFFYAFIILIYVQTIPDIGIRSAFSPVIKGHPREYPDHAANFHPQAGDRVIRVEHLEIRTWPDLLNAPFILSREFAAKKLQLAKGVVDDEEVPLVRVWVERAGQPGKAPIVFGYSAPLGTLAVEELVPSVLWFSLKMMLFVVAGLVFWNRPRDDSAAQFFLLCSVALGAYMGGYHWPHIVNQPPLLVVFMICAVLVPALCLHFYLIFPREKRFFRRYRHLCLLVTYGIPVLFLILLLTMYAQARAHVQSAQAGMVTAALEQMLSVTYAYFGVAALWYLSCVVALMHSYGTVRDGTQKSQVRWILFGALLATIPLSYSLYLVVWDSDAFAAGAATWPMFAASMCMNTAFAVSIARYRLMELDKILSSGIGYFLISFFAALIYYAVVFVGTLIFNQVIASPKLSEALTVSTTALLLMVVLDLVRSQFRRVLDRRFSRDKSHLDRILEQMGQAIDNLVDPPALANRLLRASTELFGAANGAVYLCQGEPAVYQLAGSLGRRPALTELPPGSPVIEALKNGGVISARAKTEPNPTQRQLAFLGGEIAVGLCHESRLLAVLVLGPKGTPYRTEDLDLLAAFTQVSTLALQSAEVNRTIESLNSELQAKVDKIAEQQRRILALQSQLRRQRDIDSSSREEQTNPPPSEHPAPPGGIVGSSPLVRQLLHVVRQVAATDAVVLIRGESGTGKELIARAVHDTSPRAAKPFVKVHCAALSPGLLESELFGHVKGAFTGAHRDKIGRFELAHGGTLFLDEIGDINLEVQTKLLRVLQERTIERVGSSESLQVDVRIIAATHQHLEKLIEAGRFREDLFYRLNVFPIFVSPLRERPEDIAELASYFVELSAHRCRKEVLSIDDDVMEILKACTWPGNIRQLENIIERAVVIAEGPTICVDDLPADLIESVRRGDAVLQRAAVPGNGSSLRPTRRMSPTRAERDQQERELLVRALAEADGNKAEAARALGLARSTLVSRLRKHRLS